MHSTKQHSCSFIQHVDIVWMYLHWRFLNGYWGKYLKCRKYARGGRAQTYQDSSKPRWGLEWVLLHLSTSTSLCRSRRLCTGLLKAPLSCTLLTSGTFICLWRLILACIQVFILIRSRVYAFVCCWAHVQRFRLFVNAIYQECCCSIVGFVETMYIFF